MSSAKSNTACCILHQAQSSANFDVLSNIHSSQCFAAFPLELQVLGSVLSVSSVSKLGPEDTLRLST